MRDEETVRGKDELGVVIKVELFLCISKPTWPKSKGVQKE